MVSSKDLQAVLLIVIRKKWAKVFYPKVLRQADCENVYETGVHTFSVKALFFASIKGARMLLSNERSAMIKLQFTIRPDRNL